MQFISILMAVMMLTGAPESWDCWSVVCCRREVDGEGLDLGSRYPGT